MRCARCQADNREAAQYCWSCGERLAVICPGCGTAVLPHSQFCDQCGRSLASEVPSAVKQSSAMEKWQSIQRRQSESLAEKLLPQKGKKEGEKKQVAVVFCDICDFTALVETLTPETVYTIMDEVYEILIKNVHRFEGTVNEMTGDGILAFFGAPIAQEGASQSAVRSALAIHRDIARFNDRYAARTGTSPALKMRIGINTGPVVVGTLGNDLRMEFKAVGDTVNLASRLESLAEPGTVLVSEDTFKLTQGLFRFEALGPRFVKGKKRAVDVYRVIAPSAMKTRFDVNAERGLTPLVGRSAELELMMDGFFRLKAGRGNAFAIISEAGMGKSRLLYEFRKRISSEDVTILEGKCLSYSRGIVYHPIVDIVKSNFNLMDGDDDGAVREKLTRGLDRLGVDLNATLPYILELLSVPNSGVNRAAMSAEGIRDRVMEAINHIMRSVASIRPLILAIEDLHWIDKSSEGVLEHLSALVPSCRVMVIYTYRTEYTPPWRHQLYYHPITLNRLANRDSLAMVHHLLGEVMADPELEGLILEKTEGVPFFIEELVTSLGDLAYIERHENAYRLKPGLEGVAIPVTIQDVIRARVDALPGRSKELLQTASVIEREFSYALLKRICGLADDELQAHLAAFIDAALLYERGIFPDTVYVFKHALTRDVLYDSILTTKIQSLHAAVGRAIEALYADRIDDHYGVLAWHYEKGGDDEKAATFFKSAARRAQKAASFKEAVEFAQRRVACLERLPRDDANLKGIVEARATMANYYMGLSMHLDAYRAVEPIVDGARRMDFQEKLPVIYTAIGTYHLWVRQDLAQGQEYLEEVIRNEKGTADPVSLWYASYNLGVHLCWDCQFDKGDALLRNALALSELGANVVGISFVNATLSTQSCLLQGRIGEAFRLSRNCLKVADDSGDIFIKAMGYGAHGAALFCKGFLGEAVELLTKAFQFGEKSTQVAWSIWSGIWLGFAHYELGDYAEALHWHDRVDDIYQRSQIIPHTNFNRGGILRAAARSDPRRVDWRTLDAQYEDNKPEVCKGFIARFIAEALLQAPDPPLDRAGQWIRRAMADNRRNGTLWALASDHRLMAQLSMRRDDRTGAMENLQEAQALYAGCEAEGWVQTVGREMEALSDR